MDDSVNQSQKYYYPDLSPVTVAITVLLPLAFSALMAIDLVEALAAETPATFSYLLSLAFLVVLFWLPALVMANWRPEISVSDEGLTVQVFLFGRRQIPWHAVRQVRRSFVPWIETVFVCADNLTLAHHLIGLLHCRTRQAVIPVQPTITDFDELIARLEQAIDQH